MILVCDKCGVVYDTDSGVRKGSVCCPVSNRLCNGHLVEAVILPKSVAEDQAAIVAEIERLGSIEIDAPTEHDIEWAVFGRNSIHAYGPTLRSALEAAVAALEDSK